jgi:co-chaperonin GroES (HSP10)
MIETSAGRQQVFTIDKLPSRVLNNHVILRIDFIADDNTELVTESGFKLILAGGEWQEATRVPRMGTVVRVPDKLFMRKDTDINETPVRSKMFNAKMAYGMEWKTDVEVCENDEVYFGKMASANAIVLLVDSLVYFLVNYSDLIVRVRDGEIYPLNGYVALGKVFKRTRSSNLELGFSDKQDKRRGVVKYVGKPNEYYFGTNAVDAQVAVGDEVILHAEMWTELESDMFQFLDEELGFVQRCWCVAKA